MLLQRLSTSLYMQAGCGSLAQAVAASHKAMQAMPGHQGCVHLTPLTGRMCTTQLAGDSALRGNQLAARALGNGALLVAHPEGRVGERLMLSELDAGVGGCWQAR